MVLHSYVVIFIVLEAKAAGPGHLLREFPGQSPLQLYRYSVERRLSAWEGSAGGHNGVQSVIDHLGTSGFARLRLGVGPFTRPMHEFVLQEWTEDEWGRIEALDAPFARFMEHLGACRDLSELPGLVNSAAYWNTEPLG